MTIQTARRILSKPTEGMTLEQLQRHCLRLVDAARAAEADHGYAEAVENGFYKIIESDYATGFTPTDPWLAHELWWKYSQCKRQEEEMLRFPSDADFWKWRNEHKNEHKTA